MTAHSSILTWKIPWTEGPVGYSPCSYKELDTTEQLTDAIKVYINCSSSFLKLHACN